MGFYGIFDPRCEETSSRAESLCRAQRLLHEYAEIRTGEFTMRTIIASSLPLVIGSQLLAATYYVNPTGPFPTIQSAINVTTAGDSVFVQDSGMATIYFEQIDFLGKDITVRTDPSNAFDVTIDGSGVGPVVTIANGEPPSAMLAGFRITGGVATYGGGIYIKRSQCRLSDLTVEGCVADFGAGIAVLSGNVDMRKVNLANNNPTPSGFIGRVGGGFYSSRSHVVWKEGLVTGNRASTGGGIAAKGGMISMSGVQVLNNVADYGGGMALKVLRTPGQFWSCEFSGNVAMALLGSGYTIGGGVLAERTEVEFTQCEFVQNSSFSGPGGGLALKMAEATVNHCLFLGNHAQRGGGAQVDRSTMIAHNSSFDGNRAASNGGGIQVGGKYALLKAHECDFKNNNAIRGGGLAFERGSEVSIEGSFVIGNCAELGGGVYANGILGNRMIQKTIIVENTGRTHGGGIFINGVAPFQIGADTSVEQNNAGNEGGGIYAVNANLLIVQSNCCHNTAGVSGGGLRSVSCTPTVQSSAIGGNAPTDVTGAIVNIGSLIGGGC